jgi:hypothetical protein
MKYSYHYFGIQFGGECWSGPDEVASTSYNKHGPSDGCPNGVGGPDENMVYQITST